MGVGTAKPGMEAQGDKGEPPDSGPPLVPSVPEAPAQTQRGSAAQTDVPVTVSSASEFHDVIDVHDLGAINPRER